MEKIANPSQDHRDILRRRAQLLAREPAPETEGAELETVEFTLGHEHYAIESHHVRRVLPLTELVSLPCTPPFVLGITSLRGQIVSVIDLKLFFELPPAAPDGRRRMVVLSSPTMEFAIAADSVIGVSRVLLADIHPPPPTLTGIRSEYLRGVTANRLVILDGARILADETLVVNDQVAG